MAVKLTQKERREIIAKLQLKDELERRITENGLKWFTPNGAQEKFINKIGEGETFIGIFSAANGVGKTALLANILGNCIYKDTNNPFFKDKLYQDFPYPKRGRVVSSSKNVEEVGALQTEIKRWFPKDSFTSKRKGKTYDCEYHVDDWIVDIMTYEQSIEQFESVTLGLCIFDEPPPLPILFASIARMRSGGVILIFMTPLDTGGEIIEDLTAKDGVEYEGKKMGNVYVQYAGIMENCIEKGVRGQLRYADILNMVSFYDQEEKDARMEGKPVHLLGRIYPDYDDTEPYVVEPFAIPDDWARVLIIDPHDAIPYAMTWAAIDRTAQVWIYDEFPGEFIERMRGTSLTIPDYARAIREKEGRDVIALRILDPFFGNKRYSNTGLTVKQEFGDVGLDFVNGDTSGLNIGHQRVREFLKYNKAYPVSSTNHPKFHIFDNCLNHRRAMSRYKRKFNKSGEVKDKVVIDETYKHFCDNIRHLLMSADLHSLARLTDPNAGGVTYRVVGDMGDIEYETDDVDSNYSKYLNKTKMAEYA